MSESSTQPIRGFRDLLAPESEEISAFESAAREIFALYGFSELRLPTLEQRQLYVKSTGETSDIVEKEMFQFEDAGGRHVALRPEGTPGAVRAYIDNHLDQAGPVAKLYYIGSMFRAERPQAGRYREFIQIGVETIGNPHFAADVEAILALQALLVKAGLAERIRLRLNNLGCDDAEDCRPRFRSRLRGHLAGLAGSLCESCRGRIERNPLRALDCKKDGPRLAEVAPRLEPCSACRAHVDSVARQLAQSGCPPGYPDPSLVRGLDYYTRTAFEFSTDLAGAQDALAGGGRYDGLVAAMGGKPTPAVGWALGVERTLLAARRAPGWAARAPAGAPEVFVAAAGSGEALAGAGIRLLEELRRFGIRAAGGLFGSSLKAQLREAGRRKARFAVILGEDELKSAAPSCVVKDLGDSAQTTMPLSSVLEELGHRLNLHASRV